MDHTPQQIFSTPGRRLRPNELKNNDKVFFEGKIWTILKFDFAFEQEKGLDTIKYSYQLQDITDTTKVLSHELSVRRGDYEKTTSLYSFMETTRDPSSTATIGDILKLADIIKSNFPQHAIGKLNEFLN